MAITFQQNASNGAGNAGPLTVTLDSTPAAGDLILVYHCAGSTVDVAMPSIAGYTDVGSSEQYANGTFDTNSKGWYRYSDGTETSVACGDTGGTTDGVSAAVMIFRGVAQAADGGPFSTAATLATGTTNGNADPAQIATVAGDVVVCMVAAAAGTIGTWTAPSGYTTNAELGVAGVDNNDSRAAMAYRDSGLSNPENPGVWTMSGTSNSYTAVTLALKEAPAAAVVIPDLIMARYRV